MRRMVENRRRDIEAARKLRETFTDRPMKKQIDLGWTWPKSMQCVGVCTAVMYSSDKWQKVGQLTDYKHINESRLESHKLLVSDNFDLGLPRGVDAYGDDYELNRMPDTVAELANILGLQFQLYDRNGKVIDDDYQVNIVRAKLGAARHPNGETVLIVYTRSALCCLITGFEIEKDGIVK